MQSGMLISGVHSSKCQRKLINIPVYLKENNNYLKTPKLVNLFQGKTETASYHIGNLFDICLLFANL